MKIALVCTEKLPVPAVAGGAVQLYIEGILPYLSQNHQITVYNVAHPMLASTEINGNVEYIRVTAKSADEYINNIKNIISDNYDLVHVFNRPLWILTLAEKVKNAKLSLSVHNEMFHPKKISLEQGIECIEKVEFINTVSKFIANGIRKRFPTADNKLNVVYSGVDIDQYKPVWTDEGIANKNKLKEHYSIPKENQVVLFVGRLSIKKGVHILLEAMKELMNEKSNISMVIVGSKWYGENKQDDYTKYVQRLSEEVNGQILFTGFIPPSEIPAHYNLGDIFVCPSQWNEPLARVHYEAMAGGLPIITTNRGGNAEVVAGFGNGFVLDDCKNPQEFKTSINYLLDNPKIAISIGRIGRELAEQKYSWGRVASEVFSKIN